MEDLKTKIEAKNVTKFSKQTDTKTAATFAKTIYGIIVVSMEFKRGFDLKLGREAFVIGAVENDPAFGWTSTQ